MKPFAWYRQSEGGEVVLTDKPTGFPVYSQSQLDEVRREALEDAAKIVEDEMRERVEANECFSYTTLWTKIRAAKEGVK